MHDGKHAEDENAPGTFLGGKEKGGEVGNITMSVACPSPIETRADQGCLIT